MQAVAMIFVGNATHAGMGVRDGWGGGWVYVTPCCGMLLSLQCRSTRGGLGQGADSIPTAKHEVDMRRIKAEPAVAEMRKV